MCSDFRLLDKTEEKSCRGFQDNTDGVFGSNDREKGGENKQKTVVSVNIEVSCPLP